MLDQNLSRWIFASISKHFDDNRNGIPLFIEGQTRNQETPTDSAELRMNGPYVNNPSHSLYFVIVDVNILIKCINDDSDAHKQWRMIGIFLEAFPPNFQIFKYGDGPEDNPNEMVGCLILQRDRGDEIIVNNFGEINPGTKITESTINGVYRMQMDTN